MDAMNKKTPGASFSFSPEGVRLRDEVNKWLAITRGCNAVRRKTGRAPDPVASSSIG